MEIQEKLLEIYGDLLKKHSHQGWWPINGKYHPKDYNYPKNEKERFEIMAGAILTQNTSWKNVERVLNALKNKKVFSAREIIKIKDEKLALLVKSSGYYNQKSKKLKEFFRWYLHNMENDKIRDNLLKIWGVGKETADSILLYAYKQPYFVIDVYTKRLFEKLLNLKFKDYDSWQNFFHENLPRNYKLFNEFHALIVAEGKIIKKRKTTNPINSSFF